VRDTSTLIPTTSRSSGRNAVVNEGVLRRFGLSPKLPELEERREERLAPAHRDLAVAACMAHDRARYHASQPRAAIYVLEG
jgi:hypothetical protein